jgi:hypothetical protein
MKRPTIELIYHGVIGGILAGLVVVLWFLVVDFFAGHPFHTPAALAGAIFDHRPAAPPTVRLIAMYSVLHFGVFALLGVCAAWVMVALHTAPRLLLGVLFGIVVQELFFYTGLFLSGLAPSGVVPWQHAIGANVVSGIALMAYLHRASRADLPLGLASLKGHPLLSRGLMTGLVGAVVVALWFFFLDVISGVPFKTPFALGAALLFGAARAFEPAPYLGIVAVYTVIHVAAFAMAGVIFVVIAEQIERSPSFILLAIMTAIVLEAVVVTSLALSAGWVLGTLGIWSVFVGNLLAVAAMGWYVWHTHPILRHALRTQPLQVRV